jgi:serine/threonine protein kinase
MNDYNVINQIGKGSFSNVHLCRRKRNNSSLLMLSGIYDDDKDEDEEDLFIIKEINLDSLVKKYVKKSRIEMRNMKHLMKHDTQTDASGTKSVSITPYNTNNKVLLQQLDSEEEYYYKRLKDLIDSEIEVLNKLDHKNIIKYFSYDTKDQIYYIKMEYCQYGDLYSILKDYKLSDFKLRNTFNGFEGSFIKKFLKDTVNAISYVHGLNIIHRDIKLHNFLVKKDKDNQFLFKLSDFGFACFDLDCKLNDNLSISDFDFSASALKRKYYKLCGTPYYMAPEIILNIEKFEELMSSNNFSNKKKKIYDNKIDLWSYGICLYELVFNILPFSNMTEINDLKIFYSNSNTQSLIYKNIDQKHIISDDLKILLKKLLTIDPDYRFSTDELFNYIQNIILKDNLLILQNTIFSSSVLYSVNENENELNNKSGNLLNNKNHDDDTRKILSHSLINMDSWAITEFENLSLKNSNINEFKSIMKISVDNKFMKWLIKK